MESQKMEAEQQSSSGVSKSKLEEDDDGVPLPGFRFHPTDEELVGFYLKRKVDKKSIKLDLIKHIDVYKHEPWDLPRFSSGVGEREWYFFCRRGRKYKNSVRPNRVTGSGFWKATGIDKPIFSVGKKIQECIGLKKSLVYYRGSAGKGTKTDWMMHEFRLPGAANRTSSATNHPPNITSHEAEVWTLCRIFKREATNKKYGSAEWQKYFSSQKSSKTSSDDHGNNKHQNFEVSAGMIRSIPVMNDPFYESHHQFSGDQMSLSTDDEGPLQASCPSFSSQNGHALLDANWDELRPMVEFALEPEMLYSFR